MERYIWATQKKRRHLRRRAASQVLKKFEAIKMKRLKQKGTPRKDHLPHGPHYIAQVVSGADAGTFKAKYIQDGTNKRNRLPEEFEVYIPTNFRKPLEIGDLVFVRAHGRRPKKSAPGVDFRVVKAVGIGGYGEHYDFGWQESKGGAPAKPRGE